MPKPLRKAFRGAAMQRLYTRVPMDTREALTELHETTGVPVAVIVDTALRDLMVRFAQLPPREGQRAWLANASPSRQQEQREAIAHIMGDEE